MPTGSCLCGAIKVAYEGEPAFRAVCYCHDCRKMANLQVFQVPKVNFSVTQGQPKIYTKVSDHGNEISNHFCETCGTTLYRTGGAAINHDKIGLRAGVLDDQTPLDTPPTMEVYVEQRPPWVKRVEGAVQLSKKYEVVTEKPQD
ncbi:Mss4-like protein [Hypoxylon fragiforme]|uniref:Mss4-like protein n=1 Tax=Hypoxylon fragiforme TaxID=63214 RepID=UPI0020C61DB2|nr:Mss4-like protein [Hypoxylon fragiforme]KAI2610642.1 Mss4-like protein [Hypoxylon fragiforme]